MKKVLRRILLAVPVVALELLWLFALIRWLTPYSAIINVLLTILAMFLVLYIVTSRKETAYKTLWLLIILGFPVAGAVLYLFVGDKRSGRPIARKLEKAKGELPPLVPTQPETLERDDLRASQLFRYVGKKTGLSAYPCPEVKYYPLGDDMFPDMLADLEQAEKFIYIEYFIIDDGKMLDPIVDILEKKIAQGVDVRVIYDDVGSIATYSFRNMQKLKNKGIRCVCFNPMLLVKGTVNYRDHRKMMIIDGETAFSGGINLADEYINQKLRFGHWKDIGYRITGAPVWNFTRMFTESWNAFSGEQAVPMENLALPDAAPGKGYILPYCDCPLTRDSVSNNVITELLSMATKSAWFYTPYLMLGEQLMDAFILAAQRGVDVRIMMPGIPDKKLAYRMSKSFYQPLLEGGVKIYEYTPGFLHAKGCVIDGKVGLLGTVNLDYRSLFLHFENDTLFYDAPVLQDFARDFLATQDKCARVYTPEGYRLGKRVLDGILRIFAPLF